MLFTTSKNSLHLTLTFASCTLNSGSSSIQSNDISVELMDKMPGKTNPGATNLADDV
uniref:Uncharacterized protein n=1 Tax=Romanomermis culicivorax TaxID=13658 RepID=A0A915IJI3_ROMCU